MAGSAWSVLSTAARPEPHGRKRKSQRRGPSSPSNPIGTPSAPAAPFPHPEPCYLRVESG
eukprot:725127-Rhodomonas_salina.3